MKDNFRKKAGIVCLLLAFLCIGIVIGYMKARSANETIYSKVQRQARTDAKQVKDVYISPIDFEKLRETNEDIYAWIEIPGTNVNYPIVQSGEDDSYYLDHTIDGKQGYPGSIYTESLNAADFSDYNTVVYGHNMKDGSMFRDLHKYEDADYMKEHSEVVIYTPEKKLTYRIFAAVVYGDNHILTSYNWGDREHRQLFLNDVFGSRNMKNSFDETVRVGADDRILTMSTCISGASDKRFIVEAVLENE